MNGFQPSSPTPNSSQLHRPSISYRICASAASRYLERVLNHLPNRPLSLDQSVSIVKSPLRKIMASLAAITVKIGAAIAVIAVAKTMIDVGKRSTFYLF